jgi:hypothetical protein
VALGNPEGGREVAASIGERLPICAVADRVQLMVGGESTGWAVLEEYRLGG